ncbi:MAG: bifunctional riboflavin kinase/FAD synthetase [Acidimicrobiia bacterium]|nr:bifunctional riboflavin kinase/FAD synthetase [Acidimicrobiia bacterium]MCY4456853.1 bifunctional riboflavin kinase/FAD synthetase [Acidimicrobiaceae bacterium]
MKILRDQKDRLPNGVAVAATIGVFDGVHIGHQEVFRVVHLAAERFAVASAVVTFDKHPAHVVRPQNAPRLLTTLEQKLELIEDQGIEYVYLVHFDEPRARTHPREFVEQVFVEALHAKAIVVGEDFHFGQGRSGNVEALRQIGEAQNLEVCALELIQHSDQAREPVSSTKIRRALAGGDVARAAKMLGRPYEVRGTIQKGDQRGQLIGFPTANIPVNKKMAWPADAVYAGWCVLPDGSRYPTAINIGRRPTFYEYAEQSLLEAHLIDFDGDLYGTQVAVSFVSFLRSERKFAGIDQLATQLKTDVDDARKLLSQ